jgi:RNA polymerase sigma-70 factor (ECF subfamily)
VKDLQKTAEFEELAMPLFQSLFNFASWLTHDKHQAEDLVQETYLRAWKGFATFRPGTNFRAWIFRILRNLFLTSRTGLLVHVSIEEEGEEQLLPPTQETPESIFMSASTHEDIRTALAQLPVFYREVILLCDVEEMKYQEIAELLNVPVGTVMSRISRGRRLMRGLLVGTQLKV